MRRLIALLALVSSPIWGQTMEAPPCFPFINGQHVMAPRVVDGEVGRHVYWACSPRGGEAKVYGWSCLHGQCLPAAAHAAHGAVLAASARVSTAQTLYRQAMQFDCPQVMAAETAQGRLCRERDRLMRALLPQWLEDAR